jgi:hypothetical protein
MQAPRGTNETDCLWISFASMAMTYHHDRSPFVLDKTRTKREHLTQEQREMAVMWIKDAAAGVSLVVFVASSYLLVPLAQTLLSHI